MTHSQTAPDRPTIVLDTNAVLDALLFDDTRMLPLMAQIRSATLRWTASPDMRVELARVLKRAMLQRWRPDLEEVLRDYDQCVNVCDTPPPLPPALSALRCRDADDQPFINLALHCQARWLVTRDRDLLSLARPARRYGLAIVVPEAWTMASD